MVPDVKTHSNSIGIKEVNIRKPNADELRYIKTKGWWYYPLWLVSLPGRIWNTISLIRQLNLRPFLAGAINNDPYLAQWNDAIRVRNITKSVPIMEAIFNYPRIEPSEEDKKKEASKDFFIKMLGEIFPEHKFCEEDIILSCSKDQVGKLREILHKNLNSISIQQQIPAIQCIVNKYMKAWKEGAATDINVTHESRKFAANIIGNVILKGKGSYDNVALSLHFINEYAVKNIVKIFKSKQDEAKYKEAISLLRQSLLEIYDVPAQEGSDDLVARLKADQTLTEQQKLGLIFILFIGGQETTGALLNFIIWQLALNPQYQKEVYDEIKIHQAQGKPLEKIGANLDTIRKVFKEGIRLFTPAYGIARRAPEDVVMEIKLTDGTVEKKFINKDEALLACPTFAGRDRDIYGDDADKFRPDRHQSNDLRFPWLPFSTGFHACPGQWLAKEEIKQFLVYLIYNFEFTTSVSEDDVQQKGLMTLQLSKDIYVKLKPRNQ